MVACEPHSLLDETPCSVNITCHLRVKLRTSPSFLCGDASFCPRNSRSSRSVWSFTLWLS